MLSEIFFLKGISFEYPFVLLLILFFVFCSRFCKPKTISYYVPHIEIFAQSSTINSSVVSFLKWCTIIFSIIALSSPIKELNVINNKKDGIDMVLSLDTSGSMRQIGFNKQNLDQNRWDVTKDIVDDFISKRINDNIGLVVFGSSVMTASPLSYDKNAQKKILQGLGIAIVGEKTALIDSVATAVNILKQRVTKSKIIILLTDGEDTASSIPLDVVEKMIKKYNIKLYTISIASRNNFVLNKLAAANGGRSFAAKSKDELETIYETIDKLERSKIDQNKVVLKEYLFFYPLYISFFTFLLFVYFKNKKEVF
ncbi:MAG: VWA domain-containing protein [Campylobacterota bacterium]|nr:VWA domain-containing protein [Campylobacterota bacterium]